MDGPAEVIAPLRVAGLSKSNDFHFLVAPSRADLAEIAQTLDVQELRKFRLSGRLSPVGRSDWRLVAVLGATAVQTCAATGRPVLTRIDEAVERVFVTDWQAHLPDAPEAEMPEDDSVEPLGAEIDLLRVAQEALALALPDFPRAQDAPPADLSLAPPGQTPMTDADTKPFAALEALRRRLEDDT